MKVLEILLQEQNDFNLRPEEFLNRVENELSELGDILSVKAADFAMAAWKKGNIEPKKVAQIIFQRGI